MQKHGDVSLNLPVLHMWIYDVLPRLSTQSCTTVTLHTPTILKHISNSWKTTSLRPKKCPILRLWRTTLDFKDSECQTSVRWENQCSQNVNQEGILLEGFERISSKSQVYDVYLGDYLRIVSRKLIHAELYYQSLPRSCRLHLRTWRNSFAIKAFKDVKLFCLCPGRVSWTFNNRLHSGVATVRTTLSLLTLRRCLISRLQRWRRRWQRGKKTKY